MTSNNYFKKSGLSFGIDVGTNSCAICVTDLNNSKILTIRNLVFPDSRNLKTKTPLNEERREKRLNRRRLKRHKMRKKALSHILENYFHYDVKTLTKKTEEDVYFLRTSALDNKMSLKELAIIFYNLCQRRGYKSNRLVLSNEEDSIIYQGINNLHKEMNKNNFRTFGEYLYHKNTKRIRRDENGDLDIFPDRNLYENEFSLIWDKQKEYYSSILTDELKEKIHHIIFFQRPIKAGIVGKCSYFTNEKRLHLYHPLSQDRTFFERINNLRIKEPRSKEFRLLNDKERNCVIKALISSEEKSFSALKKSLNLPKESLFNFESKEQKKIKGHSVNAIFSSKKAFGDKWMTFSNETKWDIISLIREESSEDVVRRCLLEEYKVDRKNINYILNLSIPSNYSMFGETASQKIVDLIREKNISLYEALCLSGLKQIKDNKQKEYDYLPYYGEIMFEKTVATPKAKNDEEKKFGKIGNPTIHVVLNIVRKMVNDLIKDYGKPERIIVELSRDLKKSKKEKLNIFKKNKENEKINYELNKELSSLKIEQNAQNRDLLRAYSYLPENGRKEKMCVYCGKVINKNTIFSGEVHIDHILPYSRSIDNSKNNKILVHERCNHKKGNLTPSEYWDKNGGSPKGVDSLISQLPAYVQWRFTKIGAEKADSKDITQRMLNDTSYMSKYISSYLNSLFDCKAGKKRHVFASNGQITSFLRRNWQIDTILNKKENKKTRDDHRHHGVDAAIISISSPSIINRLSQISASKGVSYLYKTKFSIEMPWESFKDDLKEKIENLIVVHKVDSGLSLNKDTKTTSGEFFQEKNYSISSLPGKNDDYMLLKYRKDFLELSPKNIDEIVDESLKEKLKEHIKKYPKKDFVNALINFKKEKGPYHGIRHVRLFKSVSKKTVRTIKDKDENILTAKLVRGNARAIIWKTDDKYSVQIITEFDLNSKKNIDKPSAYSKKILTLTKNDLLSLKEEGGSREVYRVMVMSYSSFTLVKHNEAGDLTKRHNDSEDSFKKLYISGNNLIKREAYKVKATPSGKIYKR